MGQDFKLYEIRGFFITLMPRFYHIHRTGCPVLLSVCMIVNRKFLTRYKLNCPFSIHSRELGAVLLLPVSCEAGCPLMQICSHMVKGSMETHKAT